MKNTSYYLIPEYDKRQSFYHKAIVETNNKTQTKVLKSYNTIVARIKNGKAKVYNCESQTTLRHVKEFLKQEGYIADSKVQIERDYME